MGTFIKSGFKTTDTTAPKITALYAADSFTRGNSLTLGSTETGDLPWTYRAGTWRISGNTLSSGDTTAATPADCWVNPLKTAGQITAKIRATGAGDHAGIVFRRAAVGNTGFVYYARNSTHILAKRTGADSFTVIPATGPAPGLVVGEELKVQLIGERIICSVAGTVTHDVTDSSYAEQTGLGLETRMATEAAPAIFDDFIFSAN